MDKLIAFVRLVDRFWFHWNLGSSNKPKRPDKELIGFWTLDEIYLI